MRTAEWNLRLPTFPMYCDQDLAFMPLVMFAMIDAAALLYQPFSERAAFHCSNPAVLYDFSSHLTALCTYLAAWR